MHSYPRFHKSHLGLSWDPGNVAVTVLLVLVLLIFLFLFLTITAPPAQGQSSIPPTAVQAAKMPQFASRLGPPGHFASPQNASRLPTFNQPRASYKNPADPRSRRGGPLDSNDIYDNGPTNGITNAWLVNFGFAVADSFPLASNNTVNGLNFAAWLLPGDVLQSAEVLITSAAFSGTIYFDQTITFTQSGCVSNQFGYNVCLQSATWNDVSLNSGTYWVTLQNATLNTGNPIYWDENSGPSSADENSVGTIPSESFTILGGTSTTTTQFPPPVPCFEPGNNLAVIHDFTAEEIGQYGPPSGLTLDQAENVYGTAPGDDDSYFGMVYKLSGNAEDWLLTTLYSFTGGSNGFHPDGVTIGPDGALYGRANGGIEDLQNCSAYNSNYCGLIYKLTPPSLPCRSAPCGWKKSVLYTFTGQSDGWNPFSDLAFDNAGNMYGLASVGSNSAVFELSPSRNGWTEKIIFTFPNQAPFWAPSYLVAGHDGNLYVTSNENVVQLTPLQSGWTLRVIHTFRKHFGPDYWLPQGLVQDASGNLYGITTWWYMYYEVWRSAAIEYTLSPNPAGGWTYTLLQLVETDPNWYNDSFNSLAIDANGTTFVAGSTLVYDFCSDSPVCYWYVSGGELNINFVEEEFSAYGLAANAAGTHLYGVTGDCGANLKGTVWQLSPSLKQQTKGKPKQHSP